MHSVKKFLTAAACVLLVSGCWSSSPEGEGDHLDANVQGAAEMRLGDTVFAFYLSPQTYTWDTPGGDRNRAYVVLARPDGSYRTVRTSGMDVAKMAWSDAGLHFSDAKQDYLLHRTGLTTLASQKPNYQQSAFALPGARGFVAVYNDGSDAGGYANQVVETTATTSKAYPVEGNYFTNASCDGVVYGISQLPGAHLEESAKLPGMRSRTRPTLEPEMLARLYPAAGGGHEKVIGWRAAFDADAGSQHAPCRQGVITYLSSYEDAEARRRTAVVSWDTATGRHVERPLVTQDGQPVTREGLGTPVYDSGSLRGNQIEWFGLDGHIVATDIDTGVTTRRFATGFTSTTSQGVQVVFTEKSVHVLNQPVDVKAPITFTQFDRSTGKVVSSLSLKGINERLSVELVMRGLAVRPST